MNYDTQPPSSGLRNPLVTPQTEAVRLPEHMIQHQPSSTGTVGEPKWQRILSLVGVAAFILLWLIQFIR